MHGKRIVPKISPLTQEQEKVLDEIAKVVKQRLNLPLEESWWHSIKERLRASRIELSELISRPSWDKFMQMRFFDSDDTYFQPLLLTFFKEKGKFMTNKGLTFVAVDEQITFVKVWLFYHHPHAIKELGVINFYVEGICESEVLTLEVKNSAVIEQVDDILAKAKVKSM